MSVGRSSVWCSCHNGGSSVLDASHPGVSRPPVQPDLRGAVTAPFLLIQQQGVWDPSQCPAQVPEAVPAQSSITASPRVLKSQQGASLPKRGHTSQEPKASSLLPGSELPLLGEAAGRPALEGGSWRPLSGHFDKLRVSCPPLWSVVPAPPPDLAQHGQREGCKDGSAQRGHWVQGGIMPVSPVAALAATATPRPGPAHSSHSSVTSTESSFLSSSCSSVSVSVVSEMDDTCHTQSLSLSSCG